MKKKISITCLLIVIFILALGNFNKCSAKVISTDPTTESGGTVNITITTSTPVSSFKIEVLDTGGLTFSSVTRNSTFTAGSTNGSTINGVSTDSTSSTLATYTFTVPEVTEDTQYKVQFSVTSMSEEDDATNTSVVTVKAKTQTATDTSNSSSGDTTTTTTNNTTTNNNTTTKSSEARLRDLGITPNDFSGFKQDTYEYSVEVPNDVSKVYVYATPKDSNATVKSGEGNVQLAEGTNEVKIVVVAEDGKTTKTYTLNITRAASETVEEVPNEAEIEAEIPEEEPTEPTEDEETENVVSEPLALESLVVTNLSLSPKFASDTYEYTIGLTEDLDSLEIKAYANTENATVEIFGNENLVQGENVITILVTNTETEESATYQIIVNKNVQEKVVVASTSWLSPSTWGLKQYITIALIIVLLLIILISVILKIRLSKGYDNKDDDIEFPGGEELDRALTEHQELTDGYEENYKNEEYIENTDELQDNFEQHDEYEEIKESREPSENVEGLSREEVLDNFFENNEEEKQNVARKRGKHF